MEKLAKPQSVEVGQRWHSDYGSGDVTVTSLSAVGRVEFDVGTWTTAGELLAKDGYTFLGGPEAMKGAAVVEPKDWKCRACGCDRGVEHSEIRAWDKPSRLCGDHNCDCPVASDAAPVAPEPPRYNLAAAAELRYSNGHPRTALDAIMSRRPPEPWQPSIDDWDLLPDAGR